MKVWIDQDLCTGDGLCTDYVPSIFDLAADGIAYVKEVNWDNLWNSSNPEHTPLLQGSNGLANVPNELEEAAIHAAQAFPGECIFIEVGQPEIDVVE